MTSPTNAAKTLDLLADMAQLCEWVIEDQHADRPRVSTASRALQIRERIRALTAAYEAGGADAGAGTVAHVYWRPPPPDCFCGPSGGMPGRTPDFQCDCCHVKPGEPCRHEVTP